MRPKAQDTRPWTRPAVGAAVGLAVTALGVAAALAAGPPPLASAIQVKQTPSGLRYADITVGKGAAAKDGDTVIVHYTGWLDDGTLFDASRKHGKPFGFPLGAGRVIKGWDEGVRGMRVGGKRRLIIPAKLAYGSRGIPGIIPPNARLTFDVELLRILPKAGAGASKSGKP